MKGISAFRPGKIWLTLAAVALLSAVVLPTKADEDGDHHHAAAVHVDLLTGRSAFTDDVQAQLRVKVGQGRTVVRNMHDPNHVLLAELTFEPGSLVDWHTHPGPVIVVVEEGELTVTSASDCVSRTYGPQEAYIELGRGDILKVSNDTDHTTVIYAIFFEVPAVGPLTIFADDPEC